MSDDQNLETDNDFPEVTYGDEPKNRVKRGDEVNLTLKDPTMKEIMVGVGWDLKAFESDPLDLDASLFLLNRDEKTRVDEDFVFYNNLNGCDGAVRHMGDSRTGAGDGDDEIMMLNLSAIPFDVMKISFVLSIYADETQNHDFSMVKNVYFRIVNQNNDHELLRYELDDELQGEEGLIIAELERIGSDWILRAIGETVEGGLAAIAENYDIIVAENVRA
ncbi:MAG: TerD family protein [Alphaproteobacteria bacterium]|nr:TerD family protein [Alphaproteobacteria bacterium]